MMKPLPSLTFGMGDRFAHQGEAQLRAVMEINRLGAKVVPVWNKSNREHQIVGSHPRDLRAEADAAVKSLGWKGDYFVDADHITLKTVESFLPTSDFFTLDVADAVGRPSEAAEVESFLRAIPGLGEQLECEGLAEPLQLTRESAEAAAGQFLEAIKSAGELYRLIAARKDSPFAVEVSIDETDKPQDPRTLFYILVMIAREEIPAQTVAPKFTGRFNKGVDYVGDLKAFEREFSQDLAILKYACWELGLPETLKLSVHSGSDKFSLYPVIRKLLKETGAGVHLKTAGTTWLEEVIGLASAGGEGLNLAKEIYAEAFSHREELCAPYATVIDINPSRLPEPAAVAQWDSSQFRKALEHTPGEPDYNPDLRQLLHVGFKVAAKMETRYTDALKQHAGAVGKCVTNNLLERHLKPLFA
jgi:hypothetical protein